MKEIGGYIELEEYAGKEFHLNAIALNCGRSCLEYLLKAKNIKKVYIPYFLCSSVKNLLNKNECEYEFYHVGQDFRLQFDKVLDIDEYLYIVNYYGQLTNKDLEYYELKFKNIIVDNTHAFYQMPLDGVDTIYNCRKYFGVPDGGYLYTDCKLKESIDIDKSFGRMMHILGRYENTASEFYSASNENEGHFKKEKMSLMSKLTHNMLRKIDYEYAKNKRTENFVYLHKHLGYMNELSLTCPVGGYMYPLMVKNGEELKIRLISEKIYVPTLWSNLFNEIGYSNDEARLVKDIVPLPIDQRYGSAEMQVIINNIFEII